MLTSGGVHAEVDIPKSIEIARLKHPAVSIHYAWPFDVSQVARFLTSHIERFIPAEVESD